PARPGPETPPAPTSRPAAPPLEPLPTTRPAASASAPSADELTRARKAVWKKFAAEYDRRDPADRDALGRKLLRLAIQTDNEPANRFAMLCESRDLAADAKDAALALRAAEAIAWYFQVDAAAEKAKALSAATWPMES